MKRIVAVALVASAVFTTSVTTAGAATITYSTSGPYTGSVTGIIGLTLDQQLYDIAFVYGSYSDVYPTGLTFGNAASIMDAINDEINANSQTQALARPVGTPNDYRVPVSQVISSEISYYTAGTDIFTGLWRRQLAPPGPFTISSTEISTMWAQVTPVPLPAGVWLLLSALGGLGFAGWRRKRVAS